MDPTVLETTPDLTELMVEGIPINMPPRYRSKESRSEFAQLAEPYEPATRRARKEFARVLAEFYPEIVAEAAMELMTPKPATMSKPEHERRLDRKRERFRAKHLQALIHAYLTATTADAGTAAELTRLLAEAGYPEAA